MKLVSPTAEPFGSVKARTRQVPVGTAEFSGSVRLRPPAPWSGSTARRNSTPSGRSTTKVSGPEVTALPCPSRSSAVRYTVSPER